MSNTRLKVAVAALIIALVAGIVIFSETAERRRDSAYRLVFLPAVDNALYRDECSACHFLYLPGLLPAGSWKRLMKGTEDHFGHELGLPEGTATELAAYLTANAAETTGAKRSGRILDSLNGATPLRITDTPYIRRKHRGIKGLIYKREVIKSFSNCIACHSTAKEGNFRESNVAIPE